MQNDAEPGQLTRSGHVENLEFAPDEEEEDDPVDVGNLHSEANEDRFFDSRDHRVCFNCVHIKICTFVLCTWLLHGIILGALYVVSVYEQSDSQSTILIILLCRVIQVVTVGILYYGLWKLKKRLLLPFIVSQFTLGVFADIQTLTILIKQLETSGEHLPFTDEGFMWLNLALPIVLYFALVGFFIYILYSAYNFLHARRIYEKRRQQDKEHHDTLSSHFGLDGNGAAASFLNSGRKDSIVPESEMRSNSPAFLQRTQNAIAMQSLSRTPSSQINARATKFSAEQLKIREELLKQRSGKNPTGSLQQLPSAFGKSQTVNASTAARIPQSVGKTRLMSLSNVPYSRPTLDQSEPTLNLMFTKNS